MIEAERTQKRFFNYRKKSLLGLDTMTALSKCKHVFKQGHKTGKRCNKNCRGEFCKNHNKHRQKYERIRIDTISKERKEDRNPLLEQIKEASCEEELPNLLKLQIELKKIEDKGRLLIQRGRAYRIVIGDLTIEELNLKYSADIRKIERHIDSWKETKKKNKIVELTEEEVEQKFKRLLRKCYKTKEDLRLQKQIVRACENKIQDFKIEREHIEDDLVEI